MSFKLGTRLNASGVVMYDALDPSGHRTVVSSRNIEPVQEYIDQMNARPAPAAVVVAVPNRHGLLGMFVEIERAMREQGIELERTPQGDRLMKGGR